MKKFLIVLSKFEIGSIFLIDFEFNSDIFVQIIQTIKWRFSLIFINWLIASKNITKSYAKVNNKSSRLIKFINCNFESNYFNDSKISRRSKTELSDVIKYIWLNKYWEKHLHKIFFIKVIILNYWNIDWFGTTFVRFEITSKYLGQHSCS